MNANTQWGKTNDPANRPRERMGVRMSWEAEISNCGQYRYVLRRKIPSVLRWIKPMLFIMLNPSTADATNDDPTIRRCIGFAKRENITDLTIVNLFALRATDPKQLKLHADPFGPLNHHFLENEIQKHLRCNSPIVAAWGANKFAEKTGIGLAREFERFLCLGKTSNGFPRHPLYVRADQPLEEYKP